MEKLSAGKFHFDRSRVRGSDEHFCTPVTYVTGSIALCELLVFKEPSLRRRFDPIGLSSTAVLITGYRNEFTRGVLTALGSLVVVGILALLVAFGVSVLF